MKVPSSAVLFPVAVDIVALTVIDNHLMVLLATRLIPPYKGKHCLPGGFVVGGETFDQAAYRELVEETGVDAGGHLEQLRTYGPLNRDPRGPVVSVAYLSILPMAATPRPGSDAASAEWYPLESLPHLVFDHDEILSDGVERARAKLEYSGLAAAFCPPEFTITELRAVYEAVWGVELDPRNFNRKITSTPHFLEPVARRQGQAGRPAMLYRLPHNQNPVSTVLNPPVMRPTQEPASVTAPSKR